jgi:hypothetical protein
MSYYIEVDINKLFEKDSQADHTAPVMIHWLETYCIGKTKLLKNIDYKTFEPKVNIKFELESDAVGFMLWWGNVCIL